MFENAEAEADNNRRKVGAESKRAEEAGSVAREEAEADAAMLRDAAEEDAKAQVAVAAQVADAAEEEAKAQAAAAASYNDEAYAEAEAAFAAAKAAARASREAAKEATKEAKRAHKAAHAAAAAAPLPSPSPSWCATGLLGFDKSMCCAASCGRCGGVGCNKLPGGSRKCCGDGFAHVPCSSPKQSACVVPADAANVRTAGHWGDDGQWISDAGTAEGGEAVPKAKQAAAPGDWKSEQEARQRADHAESLADEVQPAPARDTGCCGSTSGPSGCWGCGEEGNGVCHVSSESCRTKCEGAWLASEGRPLCALVTRVRAASEDGPWHASAS